MQTANIDTQNQGKRADSFITENFNIPSRSFLQKNWKGIVTINNEDVKPSYKLRVGDCIKVRDELVEDILERNRTDTIIPQSSDLNIILENKDFLVINKPKGIPVHPGIGNMDKTLANYVVGYLKEKGELDPKIERGGIVHRLDKSVSGLILFAKTFEAQKYFQKQFEEHNVNKIYYATVIPPKSMNTEIEHLTLGKPLSAENEIGNLIARNFEVDNTWLKVEGYIGRSSVNRMKMVFRKYPYGKAKYALTYIKPMDDKNLLIIIKTGRMYQIRATLEYLGLSIVGDTLFETMKGGKIPDEIELESVVLSSKDMRGKTFIARLK
jgi:23S rRNA pseudouridine1911/1915/1917 synthase